MLCKESTKQNTENVRKTNVNSVNHLEIEDGRKLIDCNNYFRNVTKLTVSSALHGSLIYLDISLKRVIQLTKISTLIIDSYNFECEQLILLLQLMPNVHTLTCDCRSISNAQSMEIQNTESFHLLSKSNKIKNLSIEERYSMENIQLFILLCSHVKQLTIETCAQNFDSILRFIFSKNRSNIRHLSLLCIKSTSKSAAETMKTLIESEALLDNYVFKLIGSKFYLWW